MIKSRGDINGRETLILGLSFGNLKKFKERPLDTYILIPKEEVGCNMDIMIMSGKTEEDIVKILIPQLTKDGKIVPDTDTEH